MDSTKKQKSSNDNDLHELSNLLGLSQKEELIYRTLFSFPLGCNVATLSNATHIPRGTLYGLLEIMTSRGITQQTRHGGKFYRASPLSDLENLLQTRVTQAQDELVRFNNSKENFKKLVGTPIVHPKFTFAEGQSALVQTYFSALQNNEKFIRAIFPEKSVLNKLGRKTVEEFRRNRLARNIQVRSLVSKLDKERDSLLETSEENKMSTRWLPEDYKFSTTILIFDNSVIFFTVQDETISARIESKEYSETMKSLFDTIWDSTKK